MKKRGFNFRILTLQESAIGLTHITTEHQAVKWQ